MPDNSVLSESSMSTVVFTRWVTTLLLQNVCARACVRVIFQENNFERDDDAKKRQRKDVSVGASSFRMALRRRRCGSFAHARRSLQRSHSSQTEKPSSPKKNCRMPSKDHTCTQHELLSPRIGGLLSPNRRHLFFSPQGKFDNLQREEQFYFSYHSPSHCLGDVACCCWSHL